MKLILHIKTLRTIFLTLQLMQKICPSKLFFLPIMLFLLLPQQAPIWEITGAEFSKSEMHTADGISIRFPRMTRIRDDKDWKSATNLHQLKVSLMSNTSLSI